MLSEHRLFVPGRSGVHPASLLGIAVAVALLLIGCGSQEPRARIPAAIQGEGLPGDGWLLAASSPVEADRIPESLARLGAREATMATYREGERETTVRVYNFEAGVQAFEAVQTYPRQPNEYYFQMGASFVVVEASALSEQERRPFLLAFQSASMPDAASTPEN
jgi:hypothetical protein